MDKCKCVLIVDDDASTRETLKHVVNEYCSVPVYTSASAEDALAILDAHCADVQALIFLDIFMPGMNGLDFLRILHEHHKFRDYPTVLMTAGKTDGIQGSSLMRHAVKLIVKPFDLETIYEAIEQYC
jgi:CheY-like chemotaxis protein